MFLKHSICCNNIIIIIGADLSNVGKSGKCAFVWRDIFMQGMTYLPWLVVGPVSTSGPNLLKIQNVVIDLLWNEALSMIICFKSFNAFYHSKLMFPGSIC